MQLDKLIKEEHYQGRAVSHHGKCNYELTKASYSYRLKCRPVKSYNTIAREPVEASGEALYRLLCT